MQQGLLVSKVSNISEDKVNLLNLRLCMSTWNDEANKSYLQQLATCISAVSSSRFVNLCSFAMVESTNKMFQEAW